MDCQSCGAPLLADARACPACGTYVQAPPSPTGSSVLAYVLAALAAVVLVVMGLALGGLWLLRAQFRSSPPYQESLLIARSSPKIQSLLGQPIQEDWAIFVETRHVENSDFAEWTATLKGPKGRGRLEGVANRIDSTWHYSRLLFTPNGGQKIVDLTPNPTSDHLLLSENEKKVYIVPLGTVPNGYLQWAPAYYKAKFGIDVTVLPTIPLSAPVWNARRGQLIAENLLDLMKETLPEKVADQSTILIGVTSDDMYIASYNWRYAINYREDGRYGVVSTARLQPYLFFQKWNDALLLSRLQKMLTKNVYVLCYNVPMSSDFTSAVSAGVMSPEEVDYMSDEILGADKHWHASLTGLVPTISMVFAPNQPVAWNMEWSAKPPTDTSSEYFAAHLGEGLLIQRKTDFYLDGDFPLQFVRTFASKDEQSGEFGIGTNDSLDISIGGEPGKYMALTQENGVRTYFDRDARIDSGGRQAYRGRADYLSRLSLATIFMHGYDIEIDATDGWQYFFPYRPGAKAENKYSVLTGYSDPQGRRFEMQRNKAGDLLRVTTPAGRWLSFERDQNNRVRRIEDSEGRVVTYEYNSRGELIRVSDSRGESEVYRYDEKEQLVAVLDNRGHVRMTISYADGRITGQTLADGRTFRYQYWRNKAGDLEHIRFTHPKGYVTLFDCVGKQYSQSLPE